MSLSVNRLQSSCADTASATHSPCLLTHRLRRSLETFHTSLCIHMWYVPAGLSRLLRIREMLIPSLRSYYYLTTNYFNPASLMSGVWSLRVSSGCTLSCDLQHRLQLISRPPAHPRRDGNAHSEAIANVPADSHTSGDRDLRLPQVSK